MSFDYVLLNNTLIRRDEAKIHIDDSGFLYGFGCFDTILALNQRPLFIEEHIHRLRNSISALKISGMENFLTQLDQNIQDLIRKNNYINARVRVTLTKGIIDLSKVHLESTNITQLITTTKLPDNYFNTNIIPIKVMVSKYIRNHPFAIPSSLKLTSLANHLFASIEAKENGFDDGIMLNSEGYVTEGSTFNLFFIKDNKIYTPHLDTGILPGITRSVLLNLFNKENLQYEEGYYSLEELYAMDEIFASSSVKGIVPIVQVNDLSITNHTMTHRIQQIYYQHLKSLIL